jgi:DNA-binding NtrC family response regulator
MPEMDGITLLKELKQRDDGSALDVIVLTGQGSEDVAIQALRAGAFDYLRKTELTNLDILLARAEEHLRLKLENERLTTRFDKELEVHTAPLREQVRQIELALRTELGLDRVHIFSDTMRRVFEQARMFHAKRDVPVLIEGESGTGKELVARYLHYGDASVGGPFVALNCTTMSTELFQSELFGYEGGAFTGAKTTGSPGKLELAQGGTLFLDEIGEMALEFQVRLLRVLETREYYRVGGLKKLRTDARFVFATNRALADAVAEKQFRNDLYHRLHVGHIVIPPLRERRGEILPFAETFLAEFNRKYGSDVKGFSPEAQHYLCTHAWEGNVRELRNTIERAVILADGPVLTPAALSGTRYSPTAVQTGTTWDLPEDGFELEKHEIDLVRRALDKHGGNKTQTARYLGLSLKALRSRLRKL